MCRGKWFSTTNFILGVFVSVTMATISLATSAGQLVMDDLSDRQLSQYVQILDKAQFFPYKSSVFTGPISLFLTGKYQEYIHAYLDLTSEEQNPRLDYAFLLSCIKSASFDHYQTVLARLDVSQLSFDEQSNLPVLRAVGHYLAGDFSELQALEQAVLADGQSSEPVIQFISSLVSLENQRIQRVMDVTGNQTVDPLIVAWNHWEQGQFIAALDWFALAVSQNPSLAMDEDVNYGRAIANFYEKKFQPAEGLFLQLMMEGKYAQEAQFRLAQIDFYQEVYDRVLDRIKDPENLLESAQFGEQSNYLLGVAHYFMGDTGAAKTALKPLSPKLPMAAYYLGEIYYQEKNYKQARTQFGLAENSDIPAGLKSLAAYGAGWSAFQMGDYQAALSRFQNVLKQTQLRPELIINARIKVGDSQFNLHYYNDAQKTYNEVLESLISEKNQQKSVYLQVLLNQSRVYIKQKKYDLSNELLNQYAVETGDPIQQFVSKKMMANNYMKMKLYDQSSKLLEELLLLYKEIQDEEVYIALADSFYNQRSYEKAVTGYTDYLEKFPSGNQLLDARYGLVQSLFNLGEMEKSLAEARQTDEIFGTTLETEISERIKFKQEND